MTTLIDIAVCDDLKDYVYKAACAEIDGFGYELQGAALFRIYPNNPAFALRDREYDYTLMLKALVDKEECAVNTVVLEGRQLKQHGFNIAGAQMVQKFKLLIAYV